MVDTFQNPSDEQLAQSAQAGDWAGFDTLVQRFEARIYRFVLNCCASHHTDARELTQETFVSAYQHMHRFDATRSFTTWLFTIARRKCIDRSRRAWRDFEHDLPEPADADDPATLLSRREAAQDLWQAARSALSAVQFQALWLHYAEDLSVRDVARVMRRTQTHVKVLLFRARKSLARELERRAAAECAPSHDSAELRQTQTSPSGNLAAAPTLHRSL